MKSFIKNINDIQPSQLYINREKLFAVEKYLNSISLNDLEPLPIKKIGRRIFFTDGHTRAFVLSKRREKKIKVYWDEDDLDWIEYFICLNWCDKEDIKQIQDLNNRIISDSNYQKLWLEKCKQMNKNLKTNLDQFIMIKTISDIQEKIRISKLILKDMFKCFDNTIKIKRYINEIKDKDFIAAYIGNIPFGFLSIKEKNHFTSEIYIMGILKEFKRRNLDEKLIKKATELLNKEKINLLK